MSEAPTEENSPAKALILEIFGTILRFNSRNPSYAEAKQLEELDQKVRDYANNNPGPLPKLFLQTASLLSDAEVRFVTVAPYQGSPNHYNVLEWNEQRHLKPSPNHFTSPASAGFFHWRTP